MGNQITFGDGQVSIGNVGGSVTINGNAIGEQELLQGSPLNDRFPGVEFYGSTEGVVIGPDVKLDAGAKVWLTPGMRLAGNTRVHADADIRGGKLVDTEVMSGAEVRGGHLDDSKVMSGAEIRGGHLENSTVMTGAEVRGGTWSIRRSGPARRCAVGCSSR